MSTDMQRRPAWIQTTEKCRHFNGLMSKVCKAGVAYETFRVPNQGMRTSLPCFVDGLSVPCAERDFPNEAEAKAQEAESEAYIKAYFEKVAMGICPICDRLMTKKQVGRCVYGDPCGHRLYQGTIPKEAKR